MLFDLVQGCSLNVILLLFIFIFELEMWVEMWFFFEIIYSCSYIYIICGMVDDLSIVFDGIVMDEEIIN